MANLSRIWTRRATARARDDRGTAIVEFAIVVPLFLTLIFGIVDFGFMINRDTLVNNAAREGAREGALNPDATEIENVIRTALGDLDQTAITVTVSCRKPNNATCSSFSKDATSGGVVIVDVAYEHDWITFMPASAGMGGSIKLAKSAEMRIE